MLTRAQVVQRLKALVELYQSSRLGRTMSRYSTGKGALLAGGMAYTGLFSVFAALAIGVSVLMSTIGRNPQVRDAVVDAVDSMLPGVLDDGSGAGVVTLDQLTVGSALNVGSVIAFLTLLYTAMGFMGALKTALWAMFGIVSVPGNAVTKQLSNLLGFLVIVVGVVVTAGAALLTNTFSEVATWIPAWLVGHGTRLAALVASYLIDSSVLALVITVCGVRPPLRDLALGCALGGVVLGGLREMGTRAVGSVADNPILASFAAIVVLILWLHLASRAVLLVAAWTANPPRPTVVDHPAELHARERPNYVTLSVPETLAWPRQVMTGTLEPDPTAHPDYVPPVDVPDDDLPAALAPRRGWRASFLRRRYLRARAAAVRARDAYRGLDL